MNIKTWPVLAHIDAALIGGDAASVSPGAFDALADRLEAALAEQDDQTLSTLAAWLEDRLRQWLTTSPDEVRKAMRGDGDADPRLIALFKAGQLAFAQTLAARTLDRRVDGLFLNEISHPRYAAYLRALLSGPQTGKALADSVGEAEETVSRKLKPLEEAGVIQRVRRGQATVNLLTPAAMDWLAHQGVKPLGVTAPPLSRPVQMRLAEHTRSVANHLKEPPVLGLAPAGG